MTRILCGNSGRWPGSAGWTGRILFWPPVPIETLVNYVGAVDLELMPIEPIVQSHYYVLPNKLFESIQAETPLIASDLPEMQRIVAQYGVGLTCKPNDVDGLCRCIDQMRGDAGVLCRLQRKPAPRQAGPLLGKGKTRIAAGLPGLAVRKGVPCEIRKTDVPGYCRQLPRQAGAGGRCRFAGGRSPSSARTGIRGLTRKRPKFASSRRLRCRPGCRGCCGTCASWPTGCGMCWPSAGCRPMC